MTLRRLASECENRWSCPGVWEDDSDPDQVIIVGEVLEPSPVPLSLGEVAVRLRRQTIRDSGVGA